MGDTHLEYHNGKVDPVPVPPRQWVGKACHLMGRRWNHAEPESLLQKSWGLSVEMPGRQVSAATFSNGGHHRGILNQCRITVEVLPPTGMEEGTCREGSSLESEVARRRCPVQAARSLLCGGNENVLVQVGIGKAASTLYVLWVVGRHY